eukprot:gene4906-5381_t
MLATTSSITVDQIRANPDPKTRRTKLVFTLGPSCWSVEGLVALIDAGMGVARFNFSHGDHAGHTATLERLKEAQAQRPDKLVAICLDTKGPEIRTGHVDPAFAPKVKYTKGTVIEVGTDYEKKCTPEYLACSYKSLPKSVRVGGKILVADGSMVLRVTAVKETSVMAEVLNTASFGDTKNMNLPGAHVDLPTLTEKDVDDLTNWGVANKVDFIAASFVRTAEDIDNIREVLGEKGKDIKIIAKIENLQGLENFDAILAKTDSVMVARGDLGMEIPIEKVSLAQKMMIAKCNLLGKPVITATQMLESMITNPRPTRAECADVANAVIDGSDCVMLSGETANGDFPTAAAEMMANICLEAESIIDYDAQYDHVHHAMLHQGLTLSLTESISSSAVKTARDVGAKIIFVLSETGSTARLMAKYRPPMPIYALTANVNVARQMNGILKNVSAELIPSMIGTEAIIQSAMQRAVHRGVVQVGDFAVIVHGSIENRSGATNMMRVAQVTA